ncbi:Kinetochore Mis14 [Penicillium taxi]|uniref:Kinetochore Mis14 n=1 Tax=Penicillium taxi TaxID=168475 RepID=UPI002545ADE9|nr:Kinetochore Mis14 [Penicillium taxi]KAJ5888135.1 Kinetochore Mis14 [Penicillium taxi]
MAHYRKIELQAPADYTYLYANTVTLSRQKLDLHLPPSATSDDTPDPMRERVKELVDEYINKTFTSSSASVSINGIDSSSPQFAFPASFTAPETVEYEPFDSELASRVTALYAQLESLTTSVAQLRREAPQKAAQNYGAQLLRLINEEGGEDGDEDDADEGMNESEDVTGLAKPNNNEGDAMDVDPENVPANPKPTQKNVSQAEYSTRSRRRRNRPDPAWKLHIPFGTDEEAERWRSGDIAGVYENSLRTLQRLQGEADLGGEDSTEGNALATTVGKAERAGRAAEVVENM